VVGAFNSAAERIEGITKKLDQTVGNGSTVAIGYAYSRRVAPLRHNHYILTAGLRGASGDTIPGALSILKGAVPGRARGFGHMAPTYFRREPGIDAPTAIAAPHLIYDGKYRRNGFT